MSSFTRGELRSPLAKSANIWNITQEALRVIVKAFPYTFFIGSKSWDLLSSEPPRGDSSATESRFATSWVIASPQRKRPLKSESCGGQFLISAVWWHLPLGPVTKSTRGRVQILLTDKSWTLTFGIQLETNLSQGSRNQIPRVVVWLLFKSKWLSKSTLSSRWPREVIEI